MRVGLAHEGGDVVFLARVQPARDERAAGGFDLLDQRRELVAVAPAGEDGEALGGERLAIAAPMKSPAPITAAVALRLVKGGPPEKPDGMMYNSRPANPIGSALRSRLSSAAKIAERNAREAP